MLGRKIMRFSLNFKIQIGQAINRFGSRDLRWSKEGMLRIEMDLMRQFFIPTLEKIKQVNKTCPPTKIQ